MGRSGYTEDCENDWQLIRWRGAVASSIRGKRGQALLREMLEALDAMPEKRLIAHDLEVKEMPNPLLPWIFAECREGDWYYPFQGMFRKPPEIGVCALGALGVRRGVDLSELDTEDYDTLAGVFGVASALIQEIEYMNDETGWSPTPEQRWRNMRAWVVAQLKDPTP